jgi:RNA polymerase sigma-B factor
MVISAIDEAPTRAVRREETARLLAKAAQLKGRRRDQVIDQVIVLNIGVAHAIAHRYRNRSVAVEDLEQVACMALVRAAHKFDVDQNRDFLTYAVPTISGEIKRHFRDQGWTIRPPRRVQEIQSKVIHTYHRGEEHGAPPSAARIAEQLDLPVDDVAEALQAEGCFRPVSLDVPVTADGRPAIDQLTADEDSEQRALEARLILGPAVRHLSERDRKILRLRFVEDRTQQQIGDELGVTQMQASRLLKRILDQLRRDLGADSVSA